MVAAILGASIELSLCLSVSLSLCLPAEPLNL